MNNHGDLITISPRFLTKFECGITVAELKRDIEAVDLYGKEGRKSKHYKLTPKDVNFNMLEDLFLVAAKASYNVQLYTEQDDIWFAQYEAPDGYSGIHHDLLFTYRKPTHKKISCTLLLSDPSDYEGGELKFYPDYTLGKTQQKQLKERRQGTLIMFPSFLTHEVTPVTKGTRNVLLGFLHGPDFV